MLQHLLTGRLNRKNYFLTVLYVAMFGLVAGLFSAVVPSATEPTIDFIVNIIFYLYAAAVIPVDIRRAHDIGWKGNWIVVLTILYFLIEISGIFVTGNNSLYIAGALLIGALNIIAFFFLLFMPGDEGVNAYGERDISNHLKTFNLKAVLLNK